MNLSEPGVGDFILLEDVNEESFLENLRLRFEKDRIYVSGPEVKFDLNHQIHDLIS